MKGILLIGTTLLALSLNAAAFHPPSTGPYSGQVAQGETDHHAYDNNPHNDPCIDVMAFYNVILRYAPATDALSLSAGGQTALGQDGVAYVSFAAPYCTAFDIAVTGVSVASVADYTVTVERSTGEIA